MARNITGDWRELFDVALFEPNRARLRHCIQQAKNAIRNRLDALMPDAPNDVILNDKAENERIMSERIALSDALTTLAELHKIVYARRSSAATKCDDARAAGHPGPQ